MSQTFYHVSSTYSDGDDLLSWDAYTERYGETPGAWKWDEAEEGFDTDIVCLFRAIEDAREFVATFGGTHILEVTIPDDDDQCRFVTNEEGYDAVMRMIPAEYITVVDG